MAVTVRPYVNGGWEVDIRFRRDDGSVVRERTKNPVTGKAAVMRWAEARERHLIKHGRPVRSVKVELGKEVAGVPTLKDFATRFLDGYARANREKPSGVASKETILRVHLVPRFGAKTLDALTTEGVQQLKAELNTRAPKTVNNILTVLNTLLKTAVAWGVIEKMPCAITLVRAPKTVATFHDFDAYERLVEAARTDGAAAELIVLLGGEAGLRCGEIMALEWADVDLEKRQLTVARSEWKGHVTAPKNGRTRYVPLTVRLAQALRTGRHLRHTRVLVNEAQQPLTQKVVQSIVARVARRAHVASGVHALRHTFCSHLAMRGAPARAIQELAGHQNLETTLRYMHLSPAALHGSIALLELRGPAGSEVGRMVEAAGK